MFFESMYTEHNIANKNSQCFLPQTTSFSPATDRQQRAGKLRLSLAAVSVWLYRIALFALLSIAPTAYSDTDLIAPSTPPTVMVLGDSISASYGIKQHRGWVSLLQQYLLQPGNGASGQRPVAVVNASISGETTGGALARLPKLLLQHQPDIVIIELGGNDALRGFPIKALRHNLQQLVVLSQQTQAKVLLAGMRIPPNYGKYYTEMFYNSFVDVAGEYQTALVPFLLDEIAIYPQLMQRDGIHPTADAQQQILDNVLPHLSPLLAEL